MTAPVAPPGRVATPPIGREDSPSMRGFLVAGVVSAALMAGAPAGAAIVHVNCSHANLQKKINHAASGSTLQITGTCVGGFLIQNKNLKLIGDPQATLDARGV